MGLLCWLWLNFTLFFFFFVQEYGKENNYSKCPKISNTRVSDNMTYANSEDPDQTAPEGAV